MFSGKSDRVWSDNSMHLVYGCVIASRTRPWLASGGCPVWVGLKFRKYGAGVLDLFLRRFGRNKLESIPKSTLVSRDRPCVHPSDWRLEVQPDSRGDFQFGDQQYADSRLTDVNRPAGNSPDGVTGNFDINFQREAWVVPMFQHLRIPFLGTDRRSTATPRISPMISLRRSWRLW
jgi:hypothetical protein